ncbi:MAG: hypothetical protein HUJ61_02930 [Bacilli bacterium]|nr:hypothetical protein [Bacilli bacterium]
MSDSKVTKAELNDIVSKATSGRVEEAINAFNSITTKVLQQRIFSVALPEVYNAYKKFEGEKLIGFGREYVLPYPQGNVYNFNRNAYLPSDQNGNVTRLDKEPVAQTISNPSRKLTQVTITREELLSKMTSIDKLEQLIAQVVQDMQHDFTLFFADKLFSLIGSATFSKTITSSATDAYGA